MMAIHITCCAAVSRYEKSVKVRIAEGGADWRPGFTCQDKLMTVGWETAFKTACRNTALTDLHFHGLRHTYVIRKVREGWDYKRLMAITGHTIFVVFQRCNNHSEEDSEAVGLADPPRKVVG